MLCTSGAYVNRALTDEGNAGSSPYSHYANE